MKLYEAERQQRFEACEEQIATRADESGWASIPCECGRHTMIVKSKAASANGIVSFSNGVTKTTSRIPTS